MHATDYKLGWPTLAKHGQWVGNNKLEVKRSILMKIYGGIEMDSEYRENINKNLERGGWNSSGV